MCGDVISGSSQLWKLILYTVFPSLLITQMTTIVMSLTGTASLEDTVFPPRTHPLFLSLFVVPLLPPLPTPSPAGPAGEAGKEKIENNNKKDSFFLWTRKGNDLRMQYHVGAESRTESAGEGHCKIHLSSAQGLRVSTWDEGQTLPLLSHNQPLANDFSPSEERRRQFSSYLYAIQDT